MTHTQAKVTPINSLSELRSKSQNGDQYKQLALISASNLGLKTESLDEAINWLYTNANETSEEGVVDEVNYCIPRIS